MNRHVILSEAKARKEECAGRKDKSKVGGFISDVVSIHARSLAPLGMTKEGV
jgi:hypothetical protein